MQQLRLNDIQIFPPDRTGESATELPASTLHGENSGNVETHLVSNSSAVNSSRISSRDEMNLAEFPLAVLSTRSDPNVKTLEFADIQRLKNGETIERKWIITAADKFGLPTSTDDDVVLGLIRLTMDQGYRDPKVYFTRYELLKVLRWSTEGRSYSRLTKSLDRLSGVRIRATNAFYDNSLKAYQTRNFGIIDAYEINDSRGMCAALDDEGDRQSPAEAPKSFFIWSDVLFDSFKSGFIKKLDLDLYFSLKSAVSRRLYRYLDKHFYYRPMLEKPLMHLAFEKLGISRNYKYVSSVRQQVEPAAEELKEVGFIESFEFLKRGDETIIKFTAKRHSPVGSSLVYPSSSSKQSPSGSYRKEGTPRNAEKQGIPPNSNPRQIAVEALVSRGITLSQARRLMENRTEDELSQIDRIVRYYDHLVETRDHKISKNRVGFLYRAVESPFKFSVPTGFKGKLRRNSSVATASAAGEASKRPELRVYRSTEGNRVEKSESVVKSDKSFSAKPVSAERSIAGQQVLRSLVEERLKPLRPILGEARYTQLFESLLSEELEKTEVAE